MKTKLYECKHPDCNNKVLILSKGLCPYHRSLELKEMEQSPKYKRKIQPISSKKAKSKKRSCLESFFSLHLELLNKKPYSIESGKLISSPSTANICHILDKARHKSVACHIDNCIYLTLEEHARFDQLLFEHNFELLSKEFPTAMLYVKEKFLKIDKICTERTKLRNALRSYLTENE